MGSFEKELKFFIELRNKESQWVNKSDIQVIRRLWLSCGTLISILISAALFAAGVSVLLVCTLAPIILSITLATALLLSSMHLQKRERQLSLPGDKFNNRVYLEDKFEKEVRRISLLDIDSKVKEVLILEEHKEYKKATKQIDKVIERFEALPAAGIEEEVGMMRSVVEQSQKLQLQAASKRERASEVEERRRTPRKYSVTNRVLQALISELKENGLVDSENVKKVLTPYRERPEIDKFINSNLNGKAIDLKGMMTLAALIESENLFSEYERTSFVSAVWLIKAMI